MLLIFVVIDFVTVCRPLIAQTRQDQGLSSILSVLWRCINRLSSHVSQSAESHQPSRMQAREGRYRVHGFHTAKQTQALVALLRHGAHLQNLGRCADASGHGWLRAVLGALCTRAVS